MIVLLRQIRGILQHDRTFYAFLLQKNKKKREIPEKRCILHNMWECIPFQAR